MQGDDNCKYVIENGCLSEQLYFVRELIQKQMIVCYITNELT